METVDGLAKYPYIRESRRIQAEFTILEQHISKKARQTLVKKNRVSNSNALVKELKNYNASGISLIVFCDRIGQKHVLSALAFDLAPLMP